MVCFCRELVTYHISTNHIEIGFSWLQIGSFCHSHMLLSYRNQTSSCLPPTCLHYQFSGKDLKQHLMMSLYRQRISEKQDRWLIYNLPVVNLIGKDEFSLIFFTSMTRTEISESIKEVKLMASPPPNR